MDQFCYLKCDDCNGDCYYVDTILMCTQCYEGYTGDLCSDCDVGYFVKFGSCLEIC